MAVTPVTPPVPQNSNVIRAMYNYLSPDNTIDTDQHLQTLLNFCSSNGANVIFQDIYAYLGGANWTSAHLTRMQTAVKNMHLSGIRVYAYAGNTDWGKNQQWVQKNIVYPLMKYQSLADASQKFDGVHLDVEYWTDAGQSADVACPQLCDLGRNIRQNTNLPVGCFGAFFLKDNTGTRPTFSYQGKTAQDGEFLMDNFDHVVVGAYRNHANDNQTDGPGQISLYQPWFDYENQAGKNVGLICASETQNQQPAYITYFGMTRTAMEAQHTIISQAFIQSPTTQSVFLGQAVDCYSSWSAMSA